MKDLPESVSAINIMEIIYWLLKAVAKEAMDQMDTDSWPKDISDVTSDSIDFQKLSQAI